MTRAAKAALPENVIRVIGFDPSFRNWGTAYGSYNVATEQLNIEGIELFKTKKSQTRKIRVNSDDLRSAKELVHNMNLAIEKWQPQVVFSEIPSGSQSATASKGLGIALGVLSSCPKTIIQVMPTEVKEIFAGNKKASKREMIELAFELYPDLEWNINRSTKLPTDDQEHIADAIAIIHTGIQTSQFKDLVSFIS